MTTAVQEKGAAVVTGASRGIGAAIAKRLAGDGYGVVVNYAADADGAESVVSAITGAGGTAVAVQADVASEDDVAAMFGRAAGQLRRPAYCCLQSPEFRSQRIRRPPGGRCR